jgi:hypothetical protein
MPMAIAAEERTGGGAKGISTVSVADHGARGDGRNDDTAAFLAAVARAEAASPKRAVYVPSGGKYRLTRTLDINQSTLWSDSYGARLIFDELGEGTAALRLLGDTNSMSDRPALVNLSVQGPSRPSSIGQSPAAMDGIILGSPSAAAQPQMQNVAVTGFHAGLVIATGHGHVFLQTVNSSSNFYGMYVAEGSGDTKLINCQFGGNFFAGIGIPPSSGVGGGFHAVMSSFGFQPYGIYQEPGPCKVVFVNDAFLQARFEAIGNGAIVSDAAGKGEGGKFESVHIFNAGFSWDPRYRLASKDRDYCLRFPFADGINIIEQGAYPFVPGDKGLIRCDGTGRFELIYSGRAQPNSGDVLHEGSSLVSLRSAVRTKSENTFDLEIGRGGRSSSIKVQTNCFAFTSRAIRPVVLPLSDPGSRWWLDCAHAGAETQLSVHLAEPAPPSGAKFRVMINGA